MRKRPAAWTYSSRRMPARSSRRQAQEDRVLMMALLLALVALAALQALGARLPARTSSREGAALARETPAVGVAPAKARTGTAPAGAEEF